MKMSRLVVECERSEAKPYPWFSIDSWESGGWWVGNRGGSLIGSPSIDFLSDWYTQILCLAVVPFGPNCKRYKWRMQCYVMPLAHPGAYSLKMVLSCCIQLWSSEIWAMFTVAWSEFWFSYLLGLFRGYSKRFQVVIFCQILLLTVSIYHQIIIKAYWRLFGCSSTLFKGFCQTSNGPNSV